MPLPLIIPAFVGWLAGLLVNYLADVLPTTHALSRPQCAQCGAVLSLSDYLLFRRCSNGHARRLRVWIVQFVLTAASVYAWINPPHKVGYVLGLILTIYFALVFVIDVEHRLILHPTSAIGAVLGLWAGLLAHGLVPTLIGAGAGLGIMLGFYFLGVLFTRVRARRMRAAGAPVDDEEALGAGDVILVTVLGLMLGWPLIWFGLLFGILLGGLASLLIVLYLFASRKYSQNALMMFIPYGPYFIASAYLILFFPTWIAKIVPA